MKYLIPGLLLLPVVLLLAACETTVSQFEQSRGSTQIIKSPNDTRDYRYLELDNGLKVVLISDLDADKSAAALTVFRGSFNDPADRLGLAHFLEHMLFIGTEKYPNPDGYFKFVQANGGSSNAYTAPDHTNYFFDVQPEAFHEGLDRFAQFFISPLFEKEYVEREKNAVNSEYQLQIKEDNWRSFAVQKVAANPAHPISKFNIGTLDTLKGDVHGALLRFFENNYSANEMGLVVLTNETLDQMQPWIAETFSPIKNRTLSKIRSGIPTYLEGQLPALLEHDNIKDQYGVSYSFPMPPVQHHYRKKPVHYLANLIGHEGEGSLHKLLSSKGWVNSLGAGESEIDDSNSELTVSISLTREGADHIPEITGYLFAYLDMLQAGSIEEWLFQEQAVVAKLGFRFREKSGEMNAVRKVGPGLAHYPPQDLLVANYLMEEFDPVLIRDFLSHLNKNNVLIAISAPGYKGRSTEKWFGVSYDLALGSIEFTPAETNELTLPGKNPFLPEALDLVEADSLPPIAVIDTGAIEVFLDTDVEFRVPRAVTHVSLRNDRGLIALEDVANAQLYSLLVQDDLNALAYPALLAGVSYQIAAPPRGFRISLGGYHDKQLVLLDEVLARLVSLEIDQDRFHTLKSELLRDLSNSHRAKPFLQSYQRLKDELIDSNWTADQLMAAIEPITPESLIVWRDELMSQLSLQALIHGNVTQERAEQLVALVKAHVSLGEVRIGQPVVAGVTGAGSLSLSIEHDDAAMVLYVQDESTSFPDRARSALLTHLISPGYFSSLRTEQQLGYVVSAVNTVLRDRGGISFVVQSPVVGPDELRNRTLVFMHGAVKKLEAMADEEFEMNKSGLITNLTQSDKNLSRRASRYWADLDRGITTFDSHIQLANAVAALSKDEMVEFLIQVNGKLGNEYMMVFSEGKFAANF